MVGADQYRPVEGAEVRADVHQDQICRNAVGGTAQDAPDGRERTERTGLPVEAVRPLTRERVFRPGQQDVARDQPDPRRGLRHARHRHVSRPVQHGPQRRVDRAVAAIFRPQRLQRIVVQEHAGEVRCGSRSATTTL